MGICEHVVSMAIELIYRLIVLEGILLNQFHDHFQEISTQKSFQGSHVESMSWHRNIDGHQSASISAFTPRSDICLNFV